MSQLLLLPTWLPVKLRFFLLLPRAMRKSPLRGNAMARWLFKALEGMDDAAARARQASQTLVPEDGRLDLYVTITDFYGYDRQVPISRPAPRPRPAAPARARVLVRARGPRPVPAREQRQPGLRRSRRRRASRACFRRSASRRSANGFRRRRSTISNRCFRSHDARRDGSGEHVVRRRRRPRQQTVRLGDRRDRQASRGRRGRSTAALRRARPRGARTSGAGQAEGRAGNDRRDSGRGQQHPASASRSWTTCSTWMRTTRACSGSGT